MRPARAVTSLSRTVQVQRRSNRHRGVGGRSLSRFCLQYSREVQQERQISSRVSNEARVKSISNSCPRAQMRCLSQSTESIPISGTVSSSNSVWKTPNAPRNKAVFVNGKTRIQCNTKLNALAKAIEVACAASKTRYGWAAEQNVGVLTLKGSLDRDFFNLIDESYRPLKGMASPPKLSVFYQEQMGGHQFPFPQVKRKNEAWIIEPPLGMEKAFSRGRKFSRLGEIFDLQKRLGEGDAKVYRDYFEGKIRDMTNHGRRFGAVVLEPIIVGDFTKSFVDPLFQHTLVQVVRENPQLFASSHSVQKASPQSWKGLPIIISGSTGPGSLLASFNLELLLQVQPDLFIIRNEGTFTSCTLIIDENFSADLSTIAEDDITAQPQPLRQALSVDIEETWAAPRKHWQHETEGIEGLVTLDHEIWSIWSNNFVTRIAESPNVKSAMALGLVLSLELRFERPGLDGLGKEEALELKSQLYELAKQGRLNFRSTGRIVTIWPKVPFGLEVLRKAEMVLVRELISEEDALAMYEIDGLYTE